MNKRRWLAVAGVGLIVAVGLGAFGYSKFYKVTRAELAETTALPEVKASLTYPGAYNGTLYLTGEKTGSEAPFDQLVEGMDRNGVATVIAYFALEADNRMFATENTNTIVDVIKKHPGRFTPFYSPGFGGDEAADMVGEELTSIYQTGLEYSKKAVSGGFLQGIGEVEAQKWQTRLDSTEAAGIFDLADKNGMAVMIHTSPEQSGQLAALLGKYPNTTFLLHLFANDFDRSRTQIIDLMRQYPNLMYTIDADHMMFDASGQPPIGLLYKYQDQDAKSGAAQFAQDFDAKFNTLLDQSVSRYQPLIAAMPGRVTIGTELSTDYSYEPEVFDRTIKLIRHFIASQDAGTQENLAYKNALALFGPGLTLK